MTAPDDIPHQTEDVPGRPIAITIVATIVTIAACFVVVWLLLGRRLESDNTAQTFETVPPSPPFETHTALEQVREAQHDELEHWTWADREHRVVRVPIDIAIDRYLQQRGGK